jgi:hypothetical protein
VVWLRVEGREKKTRRAKNGFVIGRWKILPVPELRVSAVVVAVAQAAAAVAQAVAAAAAAQAVVAAAPARTLLVIFKMEVVRRSILPQMQVTTMVTTTHLLSTNPNPAAAVQLSLSPAAKERTVSSRLQIAA